MDTSARRRSGWVSLVLTAAARTVLGVLVSLLVWAVAPAAAGLHPTVVMTGSMLPRLVPGDVVFSRSVPSNQLTLGQTLLYDDPDQPGHLRMHRWVDVAADGRLVTKGDANPERDSTPVERSAVRGVASLRVPFVARPVIWAHEGRTAPLVLTALALLALLVAACWFRVDDEEAAPDDVADDTSGDPTDDHARPDAPDGGTDDGQRAWPRRLTHSGVALLAVLGLAGTFASGADAATARFTGTTTSPTNTWSAAPYFSCASAARGDGTALTYPLDEASGTTANDIGPNNLTGTYAGVSARGATGGPCGGRSVTLNGTSGQVVTPAGAKIQGPNTFTWEIWFRTAANYGRGGKIIGLDTSQSGTASQYDRHVYMTNAGGLVFGVYNGANSTVDSGTKRYNDGVWHLVDAVLSPAGMRLYVDGALVDSDTSVTAGENYQGWLRIGGGSLGGAWPMLPASAWFGGSLAYASAYLLALTPAQIAGHYAVGRP
ncbi:LamG-like jellyroll fold domain-containing protein [Jatrophihabitans sp. YIM 134969]